MKLEQRGLTAEDRPALAAMLAKVDSFTDEERAVALELVDARLAHPELDDYRFIVTFAHDGKASPAVAGYLCYGRTPMTQCTYDLYWIASAADYARMGVARGLVDAMEEQIRAAGGGIIRVETGSREGHTAAVHFYDALGFTRSAVIDDFYAPHDDLIIFTKRVGQDRTPKGGELDEPALYDAAFGYRDFAAERDFLLACARTFGERKVRRVLGWACGPARHLCAFADVGIAGIGADGSPEMVAYARKVADPRSAAADIRFVRAELDEKPKVPRALLPVDLSFVPLSSIHQLGDAKGIEKHLSLAASLLAPGGVHVIEATHPEDLLPSGVNHTEWTEVRDEQTIAARFRMHIDKLGTDRVLPVTLEVTCTPKAGSPAGNRAVASLKQEQRWFVPDLDEWKRIVARVPELTIAAELGDFNVEVPFEQMEAWRLILVLKRV